MENTFAYIVYTYIAYMKKNLTLTLNLIFPVSTRIDSQTMGSGEVFDVEMEGGAGGVQGTVGDVLFHCHMDLFSRQIQNYSFT